MHTVVVRGGTTEPLPSAALKKDEFQKWRLVTIVSSAGAAVIATMLFIVLVLSCALFHIRRQKCRSRYMYKKLLCYVCGNCSLICPVIIQGPISSVC